MVNTFVGLRKMQALHSELLAMGGAVPIAERLLQRLGVTYTVSETDLQNIPRRGPAMLLVNHPFGILEGAVLATLLSRLRPDVKFLANGALTAIPQICDLLIPVDPVAGTAAVNRNIRGLKQALRFVEGGGLLVVFPAGEVSHLQWKQKQRQVADGDWSPSIARLAALAGRRAPEMAVIPAHVPGANSLLFQLAGLIHPRLRTALLIRELLNKRQMRVSVRVGSSVPAAKLLSIPTDQERIAYMRWRSYLLASREKHKCATGARPKPVAGAADPLDLAREIDSLPAGCLLAASGPLSTYLAHGSQLGAVLGEIGRLREITFRAAGEGTGKPRDLDGFDEHYLHLFVWNQDKKEVVGAYRLARTDHVQSLYTGTLFQYGDEFLRRMGPALELGRSFVRPEYQKSFAPLLLLWKGIGRYVARNPQYKVLFGAVSISNQYQSISRELMVSFLERHALLPDWMGLVSTRNPLRISGAAAATGLDIDDLSAVVSDIEPSRAGVPVLLRQYLKLGGKLLGFNVDRKFSNALDGLILVDLTKTETKLLERYLGKAEAAQFLEFQKGTIWNTAKAS